MTERQPPNAVWWQWIMLAMSLIFTAEYARLILFTETARYRILVLLIWVVISYVSLMRIIQTYRQRRNDSTE